MDPLSTLLQLNTMLSVPCGGFKLRTMPTLDQSPKGKCKVIIRLEVCFKELSQ